MIKKHNRRGFTIVECVSAILIITTITACAIGIFRTAIGITRDNWNRYQTDAMAENALAAFQCSDSFGEFDPLISAMMSQTGEATTRQNTIDISQASSESSLSDLLMPIGFTRVRATEAEHTIDFFNGGDTPILSFAYNSAATYRSDIGNAFPSSSEPNQFFARSNSHSEASLQTITVTGSGSGSGEFEKELLKNGWYLSPTSGTFTNAGMADPANSTIYFDVYQLADNQPVTDGNGSKLSYWMKLGYYGNASYEQDTWTKANNTTVTYLAYRYGSNTTWHDLDSNFNWDYYPTIARKAGGNSDTKNHYFQCTAYTQGSSTTENFTINCGSAMEISLTGSEITIKSVTKASDDTAAHNEKSETHSRSYSTTPLEKALFNKGYILFYGNNCYQAGGDLYFYVWDITADGYLKSGTKFICCRVSGNRSGSGLWYEAETDFKATSITFGTLSKNPDNFGSYSELAGSFTALAEPVVTWEGDMSETTWLFPAYMMDTCAFYKSLDNDKTTVDEAAKHDFICSISKIDDHGGKVTHDLIWTDYTPTEGNGVIYYALSKTGEIKLFSASRIAETNEALFTYTGAVTGASALTALSDGAVQFRADGDPDKDGYQCYCCRERLRIHKIRLQGSSILFLQNAGGNEITVFSFDYENPSYADEDFEAVKAAAGVYRSCYQTIGSNEATLTTKLSAGYPRLHWDDSTGFYSIVIYPDSETTEGGTEIFASSDSTPASDFCDLKKDKDIKRKTTITDVTEIRYYTYVANGGKYACVIRVQYSHTLDDTSTEPRIMIWSLPSKLLDRDQLLGKDITKIDGLAYDKYKVISYRKG